MQSLQRKINADTAEVKGEEAPKGGLQQKINADTAEVKGEEAPKGGLQRKINADTAEVKGKEAPKGVLQRKVSADELKNDQKIDWGMCVGLRRKYHFAYHYIITSCA
jgi:CxxC motif-containing protein